MDKITKRFDTIAYVRPTEKCNFNTLCIGIKSNNQPFTSLRINKQRFTAMPLQQNITSYASIT
jgi:hypothetical protein